MWDSTDYALDWPAELLADELRRLRANTHRPWTTWEVRELLDQAFHTTTPGAHFGQEPYTDRWVSALLDNVQLLRPYQAPAPYWRARQTEAGPTASAESPRAELARMWTGLQTRGYFGRDTHDECPFEDPDFVYAPPLETLLKDRLGGHTGLWPPEPESLDADTFYELIEVLHDLVARPRQTFHHREEECTGHPHDYDTDSGRRIYRALVNRVLDRTDLGLRLADAGENAGRLVRTVDEARTELIDRTLQTPDPVVRDRVDHAVALFQRRGATEHDKRSAATVLALVLEERRGLLKDELLSKDEGALFHIANQFAVRHQRDDQRGDYDSAFRDWTFWWYLATIELTNRILDRQDAVAP